MLLLWSASLLSLLVPCILASTGKAAKVSRLRIINGCKKEPLWVAHEAGTGIGPDPQNVKIAPLKFYDFETPGGLSGTRYWPKMRCDASGDACGLGESGGPQERCGAEGGCAPPVDTKFEATFGREGEEDWVDMSLVDGYTLPFRFEMKGNCSAGFGSHRGAGNVVDCSDLSMEDCPSGEDLGEGRSGVSLQVVHPDTNEVVGCYSPCSKLTLAQWGNAVVGDPLATAPYCCPTPPESPEACRSGPVGNTSFVRAVHRMCPGVYGYAYDDGMGLVRCPSETRYEVTFYCPAQPRRPPPRRPAPAPPVPPAPAPAPLGPPAPPAPPGPPGPAPRGPWSERVTWVRMLALPKQEGETLHVAGLPVGSRETEEVRRLCTAQALCVGFSFRPQTGEWYLKKVGTGFDVRTVSWVRYKWGHDEEWQFHYIEERSLSGPIRWARHTEKCLGVAEADLLNSEVHLENCAAGAGQQQFRQDRSGNIRWAADPRLCLDVVGQQPLNGNRIQLATCQAEDLLQAFELPTAGVGRIRWGKFPSMCLDIKNEAGTKGNPTQLWECSDSDSAQDFSPAFSPAGYSTYSGHPVTKEHGSRPRPSTTPHKGQDIQLDGWVTGSSEQEPPPGPRRRGRGRQGGGGAQDLLGGGAAGTRARAPRAREAPGGEGAHSSNPGLSRRLRIINGCDAEPIWIAHNVDSGGQRAPSHDPQNVKLQPRESYNFATISGTAGTKFWPKIRCDPHGQSCTVGGHEAAGGVDTVFEAIFGTNGGDLAFISLEQGFTFPFTLEVEGECQKGSAALPDHGINCSRLSFEHCPGAEDLGSAGSGVDLRVWNFRKEVVGCYSPCARLRHLNGSNRKNLTDEYCCSEAESTDSCRAGSTDYARAVHQMCPDVSSYASDRGAGPLRCRDTARYRLTFGCPAGGAEHHHGHQFVKMLVSKTGRREDAAALWRQRCWWLVGLAGAVSAGASAVLALRASTCQRRRGRVLWQPLAPPPEV